MREAFVHRRARATLTPVELDIGQTLHFTLLNGQVRKLTLLRTHAAPILTNLGPGEEAGGKPKLQGKTAYHYTAEIEVDGHRMTLERYNGVQEGFCEPYVVNGMTLWLDAVADIFSFLTENHGAGRPAAKARFAVQDASLGICPEKIRPWYDDPADIVDVGRCYAGDDPWMGAYAGQDAHGGLDVDMPEGTALFSPISVDDQYLVRSVKRGDGNNRWEGRRRWPDGSVWVLNVSHVASLDVREHSPLKAGRRIGAGAGMAVGYRNHSHFMFRVLERHDVHYLDPWLILREAFRSRREAAGELRALMSPPLPCRTGDSVRFRCVSPRRAGKLVLYSWTFGDGGFSAERDPGHVFSRPGIHPVTLTVESGRTRASSTCHVSADGEPVRRPALRISSPDDCSFRERPAWVADTHGASPRFLPHTVTLTAMSDGAIELFPFTWSRKRPRPKRNPWEPECRTVRLLGAEGEQLRTTRPPRIRYERGRGWLSAKLDRSGRAIELRVNPRGMPGGDTIARVSVSVPGALDSPQEFRVRLHVSACSPFWHAAVDDRDPECFATPYFWIAPPPPVWWSKPGHGGRALVNGRRARDGEFVRFTPYLWGGFYEVSLGPDTFFDRNSRFPVRVRHARGTVTVMVSPRRSRRIGKFPFHYGARGWVEILASGSRGQVSADTILFVRLGNLPGHAWDMGLPRKTGKKKEAGS